MNNNSSVTSKGKKQKHSYLFIIIIIFFVLAILCIILALKLQSEDYRQKAELLCELSNEQNELLKIAVPIYLNQSCNEIQSLTLLNKTDKDFFCKTIFNVELPDKFDCKELI